MRRTLQITLLVLSFVPFMLGAVNLLNGAGQFLPPEEIFPEIDSQLRFYSVWFMFFFFITIWIVRNLDTAGPVLMIVYGTMALGGLARLYSMTQVGLPDPTMIGATVVELATALFIPWHRAVVRRPADAAYA
jgi:hypothetical protein